MAVYLLLLVFAFHAHAIILIDDFSQGTGSVGVGPMENTTRTTQILGLDSTNTIGGNRELFATGDAPFIDSSINVQFFDDSGTIKGEVFSFNSFGSGGIRWGAVSPLSMPEIFSGSFDLAVNRSDVDPISLETNTRVSLRLTSNFGEPSLASQEIQKTLGSGMNLSLSWDVAEFPAVDFSDVDVIELRFARDFHITELGSLAFNGLAVPEPSPFVYLGTVLLGIASWRRHRLAKTP